MVETERSPPDCLVDVRICSSSDSLNLTLMKAQNASISTLCNAKCSCYTPRRQLCSIIKLSKQSVVAWALEHVLQGIRNVIPGSMVHSHVTKVTNRIPMYDPKFSFKTCLLE